MGIWSEKKIVSFVNRPVFIFITQCRNFLSKVCLHLLYLCNKYILSTSWVSDIADAILRIWQFFRRQDISCSLAICDLVGEWMTVKNNNNECVRYTACLMETVLPPYSKPREESQGQMQGKLCFKWGDKRKTYQRGGIWARAWRKWKSKYKDHILVHWAWRTLYLRACARSFLLPTDPCIGSHSLPKPTLHPPPSFPHSRTGCVEQLCNFAYS